MKLLACDMDGTLLTPEGHLPQGFWQLMDDIEAENSRRADDESIIFLPASGRSLPTLEGLFTRGSETPELDYFLAGNGCVVSLHGDVKTVDHLGADTVYSILAAADEFDEPLWKIFHFPEETVAPRDPEFLHFLEHYTVHLSVVPDLESAVTDDVVNMSVYRPHGPATDVWRYFSDRFPQLSVLESSGNWCDIMPRGVDKGTGLEFIQRELGITRADTFCFVDYFNDVGLIAPSGTSFAMSNSHPEVAAMCSHTIGSNAEGAVVSTIREGLSSGWL
ncbi:hypothetical protein HMPREF1219_00282 [Corynebacterium pyruviciproducens ATCC BAA-1742]|uniref:Cof-like hydrolase n=1 Tax=Corynebacterium pyruviciproducens ATCC BAA-1742 TaxID=1125779 RepID=S2ZLX3_9CORY|nr:HAD family hydrolase [Corynebacterium pyruviciproducens]EPD70987.1 hypothetical protein HMPREF1219_00282 [Corynebacterium pyruviciproducens ATCC BAA-1742]